jgi:hypothetical protein
MAEDTTAATQETAIAQPQANAKEMMERAVLITIERGKLGTQRKAKAMKASAQQPMGGDGFVGGVVTDADPKMLRVSKVLLKCPELDAIVQLFGRVRKYMEEHCMPSMYRRGTWVVPIEMLLEVDAQLTTFKDQLNTLVDALLAVYEQRCEEAATQLKSLYNPADYPTPERVRAKFYLAWLPLAFDSAPAVLKKVKLGLAKDHQRKLDSLYQQGAQRLEDKMSSIAEDVQGGLRATFVELIQHMRDSLTPESDGRRKRFHGTTLANLNQFLDLFAQRNVTNDAQLAELVATARDVMDGVVPEDLRGDGSEPLRDAMREAVDGLATQMDTLIELSPRRSIRFEEDEDDAHDD